ncbi:class I SAM-dependent methyltransferase family protein [Kitasatospora sp. NPDC085879]|uniref:class I SAM-dependent methyltransferase family protein n=1 Tax=Kitasatospora sp. NPDC085879 TaxID=3154769 RepID=UPI0034353C79
MTVADGGLADMPDPAAQKGRTNGVATMDRSDGEGLRAPAESGDTTGPGDTPTTPDRVDRAWARLAPELNAFKRLLADGDRSALDTGHLPSDFTEQVRTALAEFEVLLDTVISAEAEGDESAALEIGARVHAELLPYVLMSHHAERWYSKPRGYAGDYLTIAQVYEDRARGVGRLGPALDRGFLEIQAARAVKNRRPLLAEEIRATVTAAHGRPAHVTSLACGPAQEVRDVLAGLTDPGDLVATLLDHDQEALDHVARHLDTPHLAAQVTLIREDLVRLTTGRRPIPVTDQDLVYSMGLIDYFPDRFVVSLMNVAHRMLCSGGRLILGNFHPRNTSRALMDHVLHWRLIHRTEDDLHRLFLASRFGRSATRIRYEAQGINLFAECVKR